MELIDMVYLAAAMIYAQDGRQDHEAARQYAIRQAKKLWAEVVKQEARAD
jgi:hypothetical protein